MTRDTRPRTVSIPSRNPTVRRRARDLFAACPWLRPSDVFAVTRYATLCEKFRHVEETLDKLGTDVRVNRAGDDVTARALVGTLLSLSSELRGLESSLALTATARAALGVDVARLRAFAPDTDTDIDVASLEDRILRRFDAQTCPTSSSGVSSSLVDPDAIGDVL